VKWLAGSLQDGSVDTPFLVSSLQAWDGGKSGWAGNLLWRVDSCSWPTEDGGGGGGGGAEGTGWVGTGWVGPGALLIAAVRRGGADTYP